MFAGRKIEAIKLYREATGEGLREAKEFIEELEGQLRTEEPDKFSTPPGGSGCAGVLLVVIGSSVLLAVGVFKWMA